MADLMEAIAAMVVMADPMEDMEATMARGRLRPMLMPSPAMDMAAMADLMAIAALVMAMAADPMVDTGATMARGRLRPLLMLSPAMDMAAMADLMEAIEAMVMAADPMED